MASASNSAVVLSKIAETTWGVTPTVVDGDMDVQRISSASFTLNRQELEDDSITGSRGIASVRYGNEDATASLSGNLAYGSWDDLLASACQNNWVANSVSSDGIVEQSFTFQIAREDIGVFEVWSGVQVNSFTISSPVDGLTTVQFDCNAKTQSIGAALDNAPTPGPATEALFHCGGTINYNGAPIAVITSVDATIENGLENQFAWGDCAAQDITFGKSRISGSLSALMVNAQFQIDSLAETVVGIDFTLIDPEGNSIEFDIPNAVLGSVDAPIEPEGATVLSIPFRGQTTTAASGSSPTFTITRTPA